MTNTTRTYRTDASRTVKSDHWGQGFLTGLAYGLFDGAEARQRPLERPRAAAAPSPTGPRGRCS